MDKTIDQKYDENLKITLEDFLARPASKTELDSADHDTELTTRVMWDLMKELENRITILEKK